MRRWGLAAVLFYVGAIFGANWLTARFGFWPVGLGLTATAGTYAAGFAFVGRNLIQETLGRGFVLGAIAAGAALTWVGASHTLALASGVTFLVSETVDYLVYTPLRQRGWVPAAIAGNVAGFIADTFLFLTLAGFPVLSAAPGQLVGKAYATVVYVGLGWVVRNAVLRQSLKSVNP